MGSFMKMLACHCILLVTILLSTYSSAAPTDMPTDQNNSSNEVIATKPMEEEVITTFDVPTDLPSTTEATLPQNATTVTTSTESSTTTVVTTTNTPSTASSVTTKVPTTQEDISTSKKVTTTKILGTSENTSSSTKSTTKSPPQVTTKKHVTSDKPISTTKPTDSTTDSSFLGVDKNSFTAKVILPIAAGIILAVFIVLIVCSIRSCLDRKERKSSRRTMDHDMAPMDRVMLLADSSEDEF